MEPISFLIGWVLRKNVEQLFGELECYNYICHQSPILLLGGGHSQTADHAVKPLSEDAILHLIPS